ncbi:MAG: NIPSNAP family protein [Pseudomonadota bacterium]
MKITCFIEYHIKPEHRQKFQHYAEQWGQIIPQLGGELIGYFLPYEGTNHIAYGLISFSHLADYEAYREQLKSHPKGIANFGFAMKEKFIINEKRTFLEVVPSTYWKTAI